MRNNNENFKQFMSGKGYYIALILCAVAIGISGYMYYRTASRPNDTLETPDVSAAVTLGEDLPVIAPNTQPNVTIPSVTQPLPTAAPTQPPKKPMKTASPVEGQTVLPYAMDCLCYNPTTRDWRVHDGVDIAAEAGTQVRAAAAGEVIKVFEDDWLGYTVVIAHQGGYETTYASLDANVSVKAGDTVTLGQTIGTVGSSASLESAIGDHVHFSVTCNAEDVDPAEFLKQS